MVHAPPPSRSSLHVLEIMKCKFERFWANPSCFSNSGGESEGKLFYNTDLDKIRDFIFVSTQVPLILGINIFEMYLTVTVDCAKSFVF